MPVLINLFRDIGRDDVEVPLDPVMVELGGLSNHVSVTANLCYFLRTHFHLWCLDLNKEVLRRMVDTVFAFCREKKVRDLIKAVDLNEISNWG